MELLPQTIVVNSYLLEDILANGFLAFFDGSMGETIPAYFEYYLPKSVNIIKGANVASGVLGALEQKNLYYFDNTFFAVMDLYKTPTTSNDLNKMIENMGRILDVIENHPDYFGTLEKCYSTPFLRDYSLYNMTPEKRTNKLLVDMGIDTSNPKEKIKIAQGFYNALVNKKIQELGNRINQVFEWGGLGNALQ